MSGNIESYKDLIVWQQAMDLTVAVYKLSQKWPKEEVHGPTSQARRAATSIPANIAEGYGRENRGSYQQFLRIAQGSLKELETHLIVAERIGIAPADATRSLLEASDSIGRMLRQLIRKLTPA